MTSPVMYRLIRAIASASHDRWHSQRAQLFVRLMGLQAGQKIVDVGGNDGRFMERIRSLVDVDVTIADIERPALEAARARGFRTVQLREGESLPFADHEFDITFCNSVIEHVTMPKELCKNTRFKNRDWIAASLQAQATFARELRRISRVYFVQTPNRNFPVESHTWLPAVGWLPHDATVRLVRAIDRFWVKKNDVGDWNLLDAADLQALFPDAIIHIERALGLPKSLIAYTRT